MNWKLNSIAAAMMSAGLMVGAPNAFADQELVDGSDCEQWEFAGLGNETCALPNPFPGEGTLFTAAEQVVSVVSAMADALGCQALEIASPISVKILPKFDAGTAGAANTTTLGGTAQFDTVEVAETHFVDTDHNRHNGVRQHETTHVTDGGVGIFGELTALEGTYVSDGPYSIMHGTSDFTYGTNDLDERVIKDFYQGVAQTGEGPNGDESPLELAQIRIIRDNGLEVTTKKHDVQDLTAAPDTLLTIGHPIGKWRQTSFYRGPDGGTNDGVLTYTKVRVAPYKSVECVLQLRGLVKNNISEPEFTGVVSVFRL